MAVNLPANGARVDVAMLSGMPCFQAGAGAGAGAAAGACANAEAASIEIETAKLSCLICCIALIFTSDSMVLGALTLIKLGHEILKPA